MGTNISLEFPPRSSGAKRKALANQRRILKAGRGRGGRDGRGRGSRDGRGRGRGGRGSRGGRGGHGGRVLINGVDVSDYTWKFSNGEMSQMGREGRDHIFEKRNADRRRANGGRGRGGYNQPEGNDRQANQAVIGNGTEERRIVPYHGGAGGAQHGGHDNENTSAAHRAAQGRGGQAGRGFGRGMYGRGGRG